VTGRAAVEYLRAGAAPDVVPARLTPPHMPLTRRPVAPLRRRPLAALAPALAAALAAACGDDDPTPPTEFSSLQVSPAAITALPGDTVRVRFTGDGRPLRPTALASSTGAATVDTGGLVTAVAPGTSLVTITITTNGRAVTGTVPVTVLGLTIEPARATLAVGTALPLRPTLVGEPGAFGGLRWASSDSSVATVEPSGLVRALRPGTARISAIATRDPRLRGAAEIVVVGR
jgi:hypothetical protein